MANLTGIVQTLKQEHARLAAQLQRVSGALAALGATNGHQPPPRKLSAAGKARIAAAQRARWAKVRHAQAPKNAAPKKHGLSLAARKRIAAAQRARWAKIKAGKKTS
jgi:hypothetical protein